MNHLGQLPAVTISFNLKAGTSIGDAVGEINDLARHALPPTTTTTFQGNAQAFQSSLVGLGMLLLMAILVIYIILGILYESFIHPITILSGLPSAGFGALLVALAFPHGRNEGLDFAAARHEPGYLWLRRNHHADRHRQEKRHHDDRLRARGAAQGGTEPGRSHLSRAAWSGSARS